MFDFRRRKMSVIAIGKFNFFVHHLVERYDTVFLQQCQTFFLEKKFERR